MRVRKKADTFLIKTDDTPPPPTVQDTLIKMSSHKILQSQVWEVEVQANPLLQLSILIYIKFHITEF